MNEYAQMQLQKARGVCWVCEDINGNCRYPIHGTPVCPNCGSSRNSDQEEEINCGQD